MGIHFFLLYPEGINFKELVKLDNKNSYLVIIPVRRSTFSPFTLKSDLANLELVTKFLPFQLHSKNNNQNHSNLGVHFYLLYPEGIHFKDLVKLDNTNFYLVSWESIFSSFTLNESILIILQS